MFVLLAWFSKHAHTASTMSEAMARFDQGQSSLVPDSWVRHNRNGRNWGLVFLHPQQTLWKWSPFVEDGSIVAVSLGLPIGYTRPGGPLAMARRLLSGEDVHSDLVPPFGILAIDERGQGFALQQDWLGMCRIFTGQTRDTTAFSNRPSLLATFLAARVEPDYKGWSSYVSSGHFGGDTSPVRGVRLLGPGQRVGGSLRREGGWELRVSQNYSVDDLVAGGHAARSKAPGEAIDEAAYGLTTTVASVADLSTGTLTLGLSGGKDSRVIAASFIAAGRTPRFTTNEDIAAEGETARRLTQILRAAGRAGDVDHTFFRAGAPASVLSVGLRDRVTRIQKIHDFQFPSTYTVRPSPDARLPEVARQPSITGAGGELAVGYWYPRTAAGDGEWNVAREAALLHLMSAVSGSARSDSVTAIERPRIVRILEHASGIGLSGVELVDYAYLVERVRRWYTSAYFVGMVTPFLSPHFVRASFSISPAGKRERILHEGILARLLPEWASIPYVTAHSGRSAASRVWDGDGLTCISELFGATDHPLVQLIRRDAVSAALGRCAAGRAAGPEERVLQQFVCIAVASETFDNDAVDMLARQRSVEDKQTMSRVEQRLGLVKRLIAKMRR